MILSVIIWGFADFGNELPKMTYLPTNFEMELSILSEKVVYVCILKNKFVNIAFSHNM